MTQTQVLQMAQRMVDATKSAEAKKVKGGIFVCVDPEKGQYEFIPFGDLAINGDPLYKFAQDTKIATKKQEKQLEGVIKTFNEFKAEYGKTIDTVNSFLNPTVVHSMAILDTNGHIIKIVPFHMALLAENEPIPADLANGYYKVVDNHIVVDEALKEAYHSLE